MRRCIRAHEALGSFFRGSGRRGHWLGSFTQPAWCVVQLIVRIEMVLVTQATHNSTLPHYIWLSYRGRSLGAAVAGLLDVVLINWQMFQAMKSVARKNPRLVKTRCKVRCDSLNQGA